MRKRAKQYFNFKCLSLNGSPRSTGRGTERKKKGADKSLELLD